MQNEKPILFQAPLVRAILEGRKMQTRRVINPQPKRLDNPVYSENHLTPLTWERSIRGKNYKTTDCGFLKDCPYGQPGDELWVRENFKVCKVDNGWQNQNVCDDFQEPYAVVEYYDGVLGTYDLIVDADMGIDDLSQAHRALKKYPSFCPSIHMPRWASRIQLKITDIRVERLQDISEKDAAAEGVVPSWDCGSPIKHDGTGAVCVEAFEKLWKKINKKPGTTWDENPWVWVIEFERIKP